MVREMLLNPGADRELRRNALFYAAPHVNEFNFVKQALETLARGTDDLALMATRALQGALRSEAHRLARQAMGPFLERQGMSGDVELWTRDFRSVSRFSLATPSRTRHLYAKVFHGRLGHNEVESGLVARDIRSLLEARGTDGTSPVSLVAPDLDVKALDSLVRNAEKLLGNASQPPPVLLLFYRLRRHDKLLWARRVIFLSPEERFKRLVQPLRGQGPVTKDAIGEIVRSVRLGTIGWPERRRIAPLLVKKITEGEGEAPLLEGLEAVIHPAPLVLEGVMRAAGPATRAEAVRLAAEKISGATADSWDVLPRKTKLLLAAQLPSLAIRLQKSTSTPIPDLVSEFARQHHPIFYGVPTDAAWGGMIGRLVTENGSLEVLSARTGITPISLSGYMQGIPATDPSDLARLVPLLPDRTEAYRLWMESWRRLLNEEWGGRWPLREGFLRELGAWNRRTGSPSLQHDRLGGMLRRFFYPRTTNVRLESSRGLDAFREAIGILTRGRAAIRPALRVRPLTVAAEAHRSYLRLLPEDELRPVLATFIRLVSGKTADRRIAAMLTEAGVTSAHRIDAELARQAFDEVLTQPDLVRRITEGIRGEIPRPGGVARLAFESYLKKATQDPRPTWRAFQELVFGVRADPAILDKLASAGVPKMIHEFDWEKVQAAFRDALTEMTAEIERQRLSPSRRLVRPERVARRAAEIFSQRYLEPGQAPPNPATFGMFVNGKRNLERKLVILKMLTDAGVLKEPRTRRLLPP